MPTNEEKQKIRYLSRYRQLDAKITRLLEERISWHDDAQITYLSVVKRYVEDCDRCPYVCVTVCGEGGDTDENRVDPLQ